jgi:Rrf2 family protein
MVISQKNQYALRAIFELAKRRGQGLTKVSDIARAQMIPLRFLEVILGQLKRVGLVTAKRGFTGGYALVRAPAEVSVADVFRLMDQLHTPVECVACAAHSPCPFKGSCAFLPLWVNVQDALQGVFDSTTIEDLIRNEKRTRLCHDPGGNGRTAAVNADC